MTVYPTPFHELTDRKVSNSLLAILGVMLLALVGAACSASNGQSQATSKTINVSERDFALSTDLMQAGAGTIIFHIVNNGPSMHEFVVFKTDLAPDKLPTDSNGAVMEKGAGVQHIDEQGSISSKATSTLSTNLALGKYVLVCNLPGHYKLGMRAAFVVV